MNETLIKMILKNFGVDAGEFERMKTEIPAMGRKAMETIDMINKRLAVIEAQQALLIACHDEAYIKAAREKLNGNADAILAIKAPSSAVN